ncbi:dihydrofolate reductase family protein [Glycomyces endophyticus]|uniref:Dihydrofolate reductase family protein n=1 Tax=Glycomyces endophyticus TaxID=480996 RepID=A0ABN2GG82_9ACTN
MRKVVLYTLMSLDGAVDHPGRYFPDTDPAVPGAPAFDPVMIGLESRMTDKQDAILLGRNMFDEWAPYWPTSDEQPFADFINAVPKYVVTSRPLTETWGTVHAVTGPLADAVRDLKSRPGGDIGIHGSIRLAQSLLAAGLVDELQLAIGPVLDPDGRRLFERNDARRRLTLVSAEATPSGCIWAVYRAASRPPDAD